MAPKPKYTAATDFRCAGVQFAAGDPVDNPIVLNAVLPHGDQFVKTNTKRAAAGGTTPTSATAETDKEQ